ncbi:MAG TPA: threonine ammonia-lyase [Candidatus Acidoferrales bacterium]|nr:threonine ammonia-lyase [Candidatus Acidoferrales bacterium]
MVLPVGEIDVCRAAERIKPWIVATPTVEAPALSEHLGASLFLKLETRQRTGSFKDRGAANRLLELTAVQRERGVVTMSAGNHAQSVAYMCRRFGIPATIVMPETTPFTKVRRTQEHGARVVIFGNTFSETIARAQEIAESEGLVLVHPYDDAHVIAGQGTIALEMLAERPDLDTIVVSVGGGGLLAGILTAAKARKPSLEVIGVQTEFYPSLYRLLHGLPAVDNGQTIAEGIAVKTAGDLPFEIARALVDDVVLVNEATVEKAIHVLLEEEKLLAEGAGAAPLAAVLKDRARFAGRRVGLVISGANIDTGLLSNVIMRVRLRDGRVVRLRVEISDKPGVLADIARVIGESGANIMDVVHHRLYSDISSKNAELDITFETRVASDVDDILRKLSDASYLASVLESTARVHRA